MAKIIISEEQSKRLAELLKEEAYKMPVDKKMNKPFCINPEKVMIVKKFLDKTFKKGSYETIGGDGLPKKERIVAIMGSDGSVLRNLYDHQLKDLLIDRFQNMFVDKLERELFMTQVMEDWFNDKIGIFGTLSTNRLMENISVEEVDAKASEANTNPTDGQKEAGNYKMGHFSVKGMPISIENPKGSFRTFKTEDGGDGKIEMMNHYGYFTNTTGNGKDGDAVDVFIGPSIDDFENVYVVDQVIDGGFDESKVMLGFTSEEEAKDAYFANYNADWKGFKTITGVSLQTFKKWLYRGNKQRKPFAEYVLIQKKKLGAK